MGDPHPFINWIHLEDCARMFTMALANPEMRGPYNAAGPNPVTNADFARAIARAIGRPAWMRYPVSVIKLMIGEAGEYASGGPRVKVEKIVFIQCECEPAQYMQELEWVAGLAEQEPRIAGAVPWAPLEKGEAVRDELDRLARQQLAAG